jgi:hypothetical protein
VLIRAFFDARRADGGRVRLSVKSFLPLLIVANGRGFEDKEDERCINVKEASVSSFPKLTPSFLTSHSNTICFDGMISLLDSGQKRREQCAGVVQIRSEVSNSKENF